MLQWDETEEALLYIGGNYQQFPIIIPDRDLPGGNRFISN